jgi:hypothetical protein
LPHQDGGFIVRRPPPALRYEHLNDLVALTAARAQARMLNESGERNSMYGSTRSLSIALQNCVGADTRFGGNRAELPAFIAAFTCIRRGLDRTEQNKY